MSDPDDGPGWEQQEENERRRWEEEQGLLKADPGYEQWLNQIETERTYGDHG